MTHLELLAHDRDVALALLGPRPSWSRLRARAWDRKRKAIGERYYLAARALYIEQGTLSPGIEAAMREGWV